VPTTPPQFRHLLPEPGLRVRRSSPAAADWSALALSPAGWYRADTGLYQERTGAAATTPALLLSDPVGTWQDRTPHGRHLVAATDASRASLHLGLQNDLPGVRLDGADDRLINAALGALFAGTDVPHTLVYVSRSNTPAATFQAETLLYHSGAGLAFEAIYNAATATGMTFSRRDDTGLNEIIPTFTDDRSTFRILEIAFTGTAVSIRRNGAAVLTDATVDVGAFTVDRFAVGGGPVSGFFLGDILELLVFEGVLAAEDATLLRAYLGTRYLIEVA